MTNTIKYSTSGGTLAVNEGSYWVGVGDAPKGPTPITDYWNGITPPLSGYTIYLNKANQGPSIYTTNTDTELISLTNSIGNQNFTTIGTALNWYNTQADKMVVNIDYPTIVTSGLSINVDAGYVPSYPTINTTWYDVSGYGYNGTLTNGPIYNSSVGGNFTFDGVDDYVSLTGNITLGNTFTIMGWVKMSAAANTYYNVYGCVANGSDNWFGVNVNVVDFYGTEIADVNNFHVYGTTILNLQRWYHIAATINVSTVNVYTNAILETSTTKSFTIAPWNSNGGNDIGRRGGINQNFFNGNISSVYLYNRTLSPSEVLQNYQSTFPRILGANIVTSGLVFYVDAGYTPSYPTSGLTWYDVSGYGNNGTLTNGPTYSSADGGSIVFDGVDDNIALPITSVFNTPSVTYEVWANLQTISDRHILFVNWNGNALEVYSDRKVIMFNYSLSIGQVGAQTSAGAFNWGSWTHFLGTYDDSSQTLKIYVNGVLLGTRVNTPPTSYNSYYHRISGVQFGGEVLGNISIVRQYNRELTQAEITQNYNAQKSRYGL